VNSEIISISHLQVVCLTGNRFVCEYKCSGIPVVCRKNIIDFQNHQDARKHRKGRAALLKSSRQSVRKHSAALGISNRTVRRILHGKLNFHPYKLAVVYSLKTRDYVARKNECEAFLDNLPQDALIFFSDEAHFHISGCMNKENMRYGASQSRETFMSSLCIQNV